MPRISCCLIVKNEAPRLPALFEGLRGFVDELVVVDTGSSDGTVACAREAGATVVEHVTTNLALARNIALEHARGDWVLSLDADERMTPAELRALRELTTTGAESVGVCIVNYFGAGRFAVVRRTGKFFRNRPGVEWEGTYHESNMASLRRLGLRHVDTGCIVHHLECLAERATSGEKARRGIERMERMVAESEGATRGRLLRLLSLDYAAVGELPRAAALCREVLAGDPGDYHTAVQLGQILLSQGEGAAARAAFEDSLRLRSDSFERSYLGLARAADALGELEACEEWLARAEQEREGLAVDVNRGLVELATGRTASGLARLSRALERAPALLDPAVHVELGHSRYVVQSSVLPSYERMSAPLTFWRGIARGDAAGALAELHPIPSPPGRGPG
ncbi:MAG TPA: glycosyltransferase [Myxococcaceae bacterium]